MGCPERLRRWRPGPRALHSPCLLGLEKLERHATYATSFVFFAGFVVNTARDHGGFWEPFHHEAREGHEELVPRCRQRDPAYSSQNLPLETTTSNHLRKSVPAPLVRRPGGVRFLRPAASGMLRGSGAGRRLRRPGLVAVGFGRPRRCRPTIDGKEYDPTAGAAES